MEFQVSVGRTHPNSSFTLLTDLKISLILTTRNNHIEIFVRGKILTFIQQMDINHLVRAGTVLGTRSGSTHFEYLQHAQFSGPLMCFILIATYVSLQIRKPRLREVK